MPKQTVQQTPVAPRRRAQTPPPPAAVAARPARPAPAPMPAQQAPAPRRPAPPPPAVVAARPAAPPRDAEKEELRAQIASLTAELAKMNGVIAKMRGPATRTAEQIVDGGEALVGADDWRVPYHGTIVWLRPFDRDPKTMAPQLANTGAPSVPNLLAIPRDSDGKYGATARSTGELACHFRRLEDGTYDGSPVYVTHDELALLWDDAANGTATAAEESYEEEDGEAES